MFSVIRCFVVPAICCALSFSQSANQKPESPGTNEATNSSASASAEPGVPATPAASSAPQLSATPPDATNFLGEARELYRKGSFDQAIGKYQQFLEKHPGSPDSYAGMARVYLKQKKVDLAASTVQQALTQSDAARLHVALGEVYFRQGRINAAEKEWVNVINGGNDDARAYLGLARVRRALAMYRNAKQLTDKAHELGPDDPDVQEAWVETLSRAERIKYLEAFLSGPNNWDADEREGAASYLKYLRERAKQHRSSCRLASKVTKTETPLVRLLLDPNHLRGYGLAVSLNGHKSTLMLDTGAGGITVKRAIAEHAGISKLTETKIWGVGDKGKRNAYIGIADSIRVGDLEFQNCPIEVMESRSVANEDGLIGANVFEDFLVDIDFPNEKLKLTELPKRPGSPDQKLELKADPDDEADDSETTAKSEATTSTDGKKASSTANLARFQDRYIAPEMQSYTRFFRFGHDILVPTMIGNVPPKLFLLDTGAFNNAISPAAAREVTKVHGDDDIIVKGISGSVKQVYTANKAILQFGRLKQENQEMMSFDTTKLSDNEGTEISGFLGFVTLRFLDVKIDYRDALVDFTYDPKRWGR